MDVDTLVLTYLGEVFRLVPGEDLRFGRSADLVIDENPFMHRVVGRFSHREGVWWLQNHGTSCWLTVQDLDHGTNLEAAPSQQVPIVGTHFAVRFTAGPTSYEIEGERQGPGLSREENRNSVGTATVDFAQVPLSPEQHLLLVALYESRARKGEIEGNSVIAKRLGWTTKKFNRKLDAVCEKFHRAGVRGLKGSSSELAESRRMRLVAHCEVAGLVGPNDLDLLRGLDAS